KEQQRSLQKMSIWEQRTTQLRRHNLRNSSEALYSELEPEERLRVSSALHLRPDMKAHHDRPLVVEHRDGTIVNLPPATQGSTTDVEEKTEMLEKDGIIDTTAGAESTRVAWRTAAIRMEDKGTTTRLGWRRENTDTTILADPERSTGMAMAPSVMEAEARRAKEGMERGGDTGHVLKPSPHWMEKNAGRMVENTGTFSDCVMTPNYLGHLKG
ncbi:hypothetical protein M9458_042421, partial [Cirrhinus mrigala]